MFAPRALRLGTALTMAFAASFGMSAPARAQATKAETKAKVAKDQAKEKAKAAELVDLNSATSAELQTLPGVGEVTARKIIDGRPHKAVADLAGSGVSASEIEKLRPLVEVKPLPTPVDVNADPLERIETLPGITATLAKEIVATRPHADYESIAKVKGIGPVKLEGLKGRVKFGEDLAVAKAKAKAKSKVAEAKAEEAEAKATVAETTGQAKAKANMDEVKAKAKVAEAKVEEKVAPKLAEAKEKAKGAVAKVGEKIEEAKKKKDAPKLPPGTKININTATREELDELIGIGEVKSQSIIDYRNENGKFEKIEDIMKVGGIKEGIFAKIKDQITVK